MLLVAFIPAAVAQGPPFGTPPGQMKQDASAGAPGPPGGVPPGQLKNSSPAVTAQAPATSTTTTTALAPVTQSGPGNSGSTTGPGRSASAPGHLKRASTAPASARAPASTTSAPAATVADTAAPAPTPASTPAPKPHRVHRARRHAAARVTTSPRPAVTPVAAVPVTAVAPAPAAPQAAPVVRQAPRHVTHRRVQRAADQPLTTITRTVTRTVQDIVQVLPGWAKIVIAALAGLLLLAALALAAVALRSRRLRRQRALLMDEVAALEQALLPTVPGQMGELEISVAYRPAAGLAAGGDFYDVFELERGCVGIILGDVSGHGREALQPAMFVRHMVRSYLEAGLTPRAAIQLAGNVLDDQDRDDFATIVAAVHDPVAGTLAYSTAGHPPPIVTGPAAYQPILAASSPPAGAGETTGRRQTTIALPAGSSVCFFTDGLTEARTHDVLRGRQDLERVLDEVGDEASAEDVIDVIARRSGGLEDDAAVCLIRCYTARPAATVRVEEIEVTLSELDNPRVRRFLDACGVSRADAEVALRAAAPRVAGLNSVLLRIRMADNRSGIDIVPVESARQDELAPVHALR